MIEIIKEDANGRDLVDAKWWLLMGKDGKPDYRYATFNSRYDKLYSSRLTKGPFKTSRCIIPASGIIEGQGPKNGRYYHYIYSEEKALALGGIYKTYQFGDETLTTASIITCPGNPKLEHIHAKSIPLMLDYEDTSLIDMWLDSTLNDSEAFRHLLTNTLHQDLTAVPINGARDLEPRGEAIDIAADE